MIISREIQLDYGHTLPNHFSFCNQIHGHRAKVVAYVEGDIISKANDSSQGMVLDFKFLKQAMMERIHDVLDHGFAVWTYDVEDRLFITNRNKKVLITELPPTAESLAAWAYGAIKPELPAGVKLIKVEWWETPSSCAIYQENKEE